MPSRYLSHRNFFSYLYQLGQILCLAVLIIILLPGYASSQFDDEIVIPENVVTFNYRLEPNEPRPGEHARIIVDLDVHSGWHVYSVIPDKGEFAPIPTSLTLENDSLIIVGPVYESNPINAKDPVLEMVLSFHEKTATLFQNILIPEDITGGTVLNSAVKLRYQACSDRICLPPKTEELSTDITIGKGNIREKYKLPQFAVDTPPENLSEIDQALSGGFLGFMGLAIIAGFLALLTPCVFPMIPVTVAFFTKQSHTGTRETLRLAVLFGVGIVGTYTVTGMLLSVILGAAGAVQFATNGWINLAIGLMFTLFAFSLMGFLQLTAPGGLTNIVDRWSRQLRGTFGVLAMGLVFTLTSFTCTVQFVGTMLIAASQGMWFWPVVGMLVFSTVFAFPFFLLGLFPRLIQKMHSKSGSWMEHLKIILGLLELAAAFKFFSNADLVWQWGLINREFVLAAWVIICLIGTLYLLGMLKIHHVRIIKTGSAGFVAAFVFAALGIYLVRGLAGVQLNPWVDTFLPPDLQILEQNKLAFSESTDTASGIKAHSLPWHNDLSDALGQAKAENKHVFIDFTGYTCVNCRWMEKNIFSHPDVIELFKNKFVLVQLFTDGGEKAAENQQIQISRFQTVALPLYVILDASDNVLAKQAGIMKPAEKFLQFLN